MVSILNEKEIQSGIFGVIFAFKQLSNQKKRTMKSKLFFLIILVASSSLFGQVGNTVPYYNWSSPATYMLSTPPLIQGRGHYSYLLSEAQNGTTFYVHDNEYFPIETWADYYLWYTIKYSHNWQNPELYKYYYYTKIIKD